jgi:hypothetical protein
MIATLHTWSQTRRRHPHLHCLVTGGGLRETGQWGAVRHGVVLPTAVGMALFRGKRLAAIRQGVAQGQLTRPEGQRRQPLEHRLNQLGRTKWTVHIRERYAYGQGVLICLARYPRGGPVAPRRRLAWDGQHVVVGYEERAKGAGGQAPQRTMRLSAEQFIGRWLLHVPPARAVRVRCWGPYAQTHAEVLAHCRRQLGQGPVEVPAPFDGPDDDGQGAVGSPEGCPVCGPRLVCTALSPRAGVPPPAATGWRRVA